MAGLIAIAVLALFCDSAYLAEVKRKVIFDENEDCTTPDQRIGLCVVIDDCEALSEETDIPKLQRYRCGYEGFNPKVCCPPVGSRTTPKPLPPARLVQPTRPNRRPVQSSNNNNILPKSCGRTSFSRVRVVGGHVSAPGEWPWVVSLFMTHYGGKFHMCGATLITQSHILTAAHCLADINNIRRTPWIIGARLGDHDITTESDGALHKDMTVQRITIHEDYENVTLRNDIAILKLEEKVVFTPTIQPICLPFENLSADKLTGRNAFVAGWGATIHNSTGNSPKLLDAELTVTPQEECRAKYQNVLTNKQICAAKAGKDSCQGDSGGPLMLTAGPDSNFYQIGIVSFGIGCANPKYPGVYTNVLSYLDWIMKNL